MDAHAFLYLPVPVSLCKDEINAYPLQSMLYWFIETQDKFKLNCRKTARRIIPIRLPI